MRALRRTSPPRLRAGSPCDWVTSEPSDLCKVFFLKCSAPQLLKRERDLSENKVELCCSAINRKTFYPTEITFWQVKKDFLQRRPVFCCRFFFFKLNLISCPDPCVHQFIVCDHNIQKIGFRSI